MKAVGEYTDAKLCWTAGGILIHHHKVLLIKHKLLGVWLNPGGHIDTHELPHQAAEREFWEETGVKVRAYHPNLLPLDNSAVSEYLPQPLFTNIHWFNKDTYLARLSGEKITGKKCERHFGFFYLVKPVDSIEFHQNIEETDGIGWFSQDKLQDLDTFSEVKNELKLAFELV